MMLVVTVAYIILGIPDRSASALAVQYTYKTYILINMHDIYLILTKYIYLILTKILFKKKCLKLIFNISQRFAVPHDLGKKRSIIMDRCNAW